MTSWLECEFELRRIYNFVRQNEWNCPKIAWDIFQFIKEIQKLTIYGSRHGNCPKMSKMIRERWPVVDTFEDEAYEVEAEKHDSEHRLKTFFENEVMSRMLRCLMMSHCVSYGNSESGPIPNTWFSFSSVMLLFKAIPRRTQFSEEEKVISGLGAKYARLHRHRHP